jgi:hypothetical protein
VSIITEPLARLVEGLSQHIRPDGVLWDPVLDAPSPTDHYAQTSVALALQLHDYPQQSRAAHDAWLALTPPQLGHLPFNRLMLLLLADLAPHTGSHRDNGRWGRGGSRTAPTACFEDGLHDPSMSEPDRHAIDQGLQRCVLRPHYPSNNWTLLAQLCRLIAAVRSDATSREGQTQVKIFGQLLDRWLTADGAFIDYPARPRSTGATPMAYHHKALFLTTTAAWFCDEPGLRSRLEVLLNQAVRFWDGGGYAGGLGRSNHALFGDGCLLAALVLLGADEDGAGELSAMCAGIIQRLEAQRRTDGLYWLNPAGAAGQAGWDNYMFLSVYNAWFAAVVSWALHVRQTRPVPDGLSRIQPIQPSIQGEGLIRLNTAKLTALITTHGQPPQAFSRNEVELRYAGGIPVHIALAGRVVIPPPVRVPLAELLRQPALAGWTPLFQQSERVYGLTDFDAVTVRESEQGIDMELTGRPRSVNRAPIERLPQRLMAALDWRLLGGAWGRREALRREVLEGISACIVLTLSVQPPKLAYYLVLENTGGQPVYYLNPAGHALVPDAWPCQQKIKGGQGELVMQPMPSSIVGAMGYCLPTVALPSGRSEYWIDIIWNPPL